MDIQSRKFSLNFIFQIVIISLLILSGCNHTRPSADVRFTSINFAPVSGGWNINRQSGNLTFSDVKFYRVTINLDRPTPSSFRWFFNINEDRSFWSDPYLGRLDVTFNAGSTTASTVIYRANAGANRTPSGAVDLNTDRFWLGCTGGKGLVRGNGGKEDSGHANVYLTTADLQPSSNTVRVGGIRESPRHSISCI